MKNIQKRTSFFVCPSTTLHVWPHCRINWRRDSVESFLFSATVFFCKPSHDIVIVRPQSTSHPSIEREKKISPAGTFFASLNSPGARSHCAMATAICELSYLASRTSLLSSTVYVSDNIPPNPNSNHSLCVFSKLSRAVVRRPSANLFLIQIPHSYWKCNYHCRPFVSARRPRLIVSNLSTVFVVKFLPRRCCAECFFCTASMRLFTFISTTIIAIETTTTSDCTWNYVVSPNLNLLSEVLD